MSPYYSRANVLRDALYYAFADPNTRSVAEYRTRGKGNWKPLTDNPRLVNLQRYDYRVVTKRLWTTVSTIECSAGGLPKKVAKRILEIAAKRGTRSFAFGGYTMYPKLNGDLTVGCQEFTKEDVKLAKFLLRDV